MRQPPMFLVVILIIVLLLLNVDCTFCRQAEFNIPPLPIEKLNILNSVKEITEYLQVHKVRAVNLTTLGFLSNLEKIMGHGT